MTGFILGICFGYLMIHCPVPSWFPAWFFASHEAADKP